MDAPAPLYPLPGLPDGLAAIPSERLIELIQLAPIGLVLLDARNDDGFRVFSAGLASLLGYSHEEFLSTRLRTLRHPDDEGVQELLEAIRAGHRDHFQVECRYQHREGHYVWLLVSAAMLRDPDGDARYVLGHLADISHGKRMAEQVRRFGQLQSTLTSNLLATTVALIDADMRVLAVDGEGERMLTHRSALGQRLPEAEHLAPEQRARLVRHLKLALAGQHQDFKAEEHGRAFHTTISPLLDEHAKPYAAVLVSRDVTVEHRAVHQLRQLARFDSLTELPNRTAFRERLAELLDVAPLDEIPALIFLDIDNFKSVNDSLGHDAGDELLRIVAQRLRECVRGSDEVFHLSGDEFTVLLSASLDADATAAVAQRILDRIAAPVIIAKHELFPSASLGIARACDAARDGQELLKAADMAMYAAKREGRNTFRFFQPAMAADAEQRLRLSSDLHRAIERGELELHYLPQLRLSDEQFVSVEALVRWRHPERGLLGPAEFVPVAEETGLIVPIGAWVLETACRQLARWRANGHPDLRVAVNVAAAQLESAELVGTVARSLADSGLPAGALELEITESALMDADRVEPVLRSLKRLGIGLAIDDFGTGYSSLGRLHALPIDMLKIDRAFVTDLAYSSDAAALVRTIIALADSLGIPTLAEGVETVEQRDHLIAAGCEMAAGWLWSRAVHPDELCLDPPNLGSPRHRIGGVIRLPAHSEGSPFGCSPEVA